MKTIKQIADELDITKAGLRKYLTEDIRNQYAETVSGVIYISETGESLIKSAFYNNQPETEPETVSGELPETVSGISDTVSALVSTLQIELEAKNKQIEGLHTLNKELQDALEREREHSRQQADKLSDLSQQLAELTRNTQILLKQEQDKNALLLPEQPPTVPSEPDTSGMKVKQRPFWQFWKK